MFSLTLKYFLSIMKYSEFLHFSASHACRVRSEQASIEHLCGWLLAAALLVSSVPEAEASDESAQSLQVIIDTRSRAIEQVLASSRSDQPFLRANAIEASQHLPKRVVAVVQVGLRDPNAGVRFAAAATIGSLRLTKLTASVRRLVHDRSESVRAAAIYALHLCGEQVDLNPLAVMLTSTKPSVRGNVALLMGQMHDPGTATMLKESAAVPMSRTSAVQESIVRIQIAEALVKLGDEAALNAVRAAVYSQFDEVRVLAVTMLGKLHDRRMEKGVARMLLEPPIELQIAAAGALAELGHYEGEAIALRAAQSDFPTVRGQAAMALSRFPSVHARKSLASLLNDREEQVRLSAAAAILQAIADP